MSKETNEFIEIARQAKIVYLERRCKACGRVTRHTSIQNGIEETLTCRECGHCERFNTK